MDNIILMNVLILGMIAFFAAVILYYAAKKFHVEENPKIEKVEECLPGANCGACGKAGCHDFATFCAGVDEAGFSQLYCPVGGAAAMEKIAEVLGFEAVAKEPTVAVLKCNGSCENAPAKIEYDGVSMCRIANKICCGVSGCPDGCLRLGDCVKVCKFGALKIDEKTGLPFVDEERCTSCGACVNICPRHLFEIRPKGENNNRVYVACNNKQKGALARKNCKVACIGCGKCAKINPEIVIENNLSYIPSTVSALKYGEELAKSCPTGAIILKRPEEKNAK